MLLTVYHRGLHLSLWRLFHRDKFMPSCCSESFVSPLAAITKVLRALHTKRSGVFLAILTDLTLDFIRIQLVGRRSTCHGRGSDSGGGQHRGGKVIDRQRWGRDSCRGGSGNLFAFFASTFLNCNWNTRSSNWRGWNFKDSPTYRALEGRFVYFLKKNQKIMIMIMLAVWRLKKRKSILCEINWSRQLRQAEWRHGRVLIGSHKDSWHTMHSFNDGSILKTRGAWEENRRKEGRMIFGYGMF